jgi:phosphoribosyl 1,2-cyclic phosphodiesterase
MHFCVLGSGSKGNATYVRSGETALLIDAGFSGVEIERRLAAIDVSAESLSAILLTHEHSDHIRGAAILARKYDLPIYANGGTLAAGKKILKKLPKIMRFSTGDNFDLADLHVHPFSISHDTADPVGFIFNDSACSLGYCTDTGMVTRLLSHRLSGCNGLVIECNHDSHMLQNGPYPVHLKQRVSSKQGHLTNKQAADFICSLLHTSLQHVVLAHLSETNNDPALAYETVISIVKENINGGKAPEISLAWQDKPGNFVSLSNCQGH